MVHSLQQKLRHLDETAYFVFSLQIGKKKIKDNYSWKD